MRILSAIGAAAAISATVGAGPVASQEAMSIYRTVQSGPQTQALATAILEAALTSTLDGDGPFTMFVPPNAAFDALPEGLYDRLLLDENQTRLRSLVQYHMVAGEVMAADLVERVERGGDATTIATTEGVPLEIGMQDGELTLTDATGNTVTLVETDVAASNGVIHIVDGVLMPAVP